MESKFWNKIYSGNHLMIWEHHTGLYIMIAEWSKKHGDNGWGWIVTTEQLKPIEGDITKIKDN